MANNSTLLTNTDLSRRADMLYIAVLGDDQVGKAAYMKCVTFGLYDPYMQSALDLDFVTREIVVSQEKVVFQLWKKDLRSCHSVIVIYDITRRESFTNALKLVDEIRLTKDINLPILLLGNKIDVHQKRQVMAYEGEMAAIHYQTLFHEISCVDAVHTRESIVELIEAIF